MKQPCWDCQQQDRNEERWKVATGHDPSSTEEEITSWKHFIIPDGFALVQIVILVMIVFCSKDAAVSTRKLGFVVVGRANRHRTLDTGYSRVAIELGVLVRQGILLKSRKLP